NSMDGFPGRERVEWNASGKPPCRMTEGVQAGSGSRRWRAHAAHGPTSIAPPHRVAWPRPAGGAELRVMASNSATRRGEPDPVRPDGSRGEGGRQILRTALTLSLLTRPP